MGSDPGHLVLSGDQVIFVDEVNPDLSFAIPRASVRSLRVDNGLLTMDLAQPLVADRYANRSDVILRVSDPDSQAVSTWLGVPLGGETVRTVVTGPAVVSGPVVGGQVVSGPVVVTTMNEAQFDVRHRGEDGRLVIGPADVGFVSLSKPSHSRRWSYAGIKKLKREHNDRQLELEGFNGEKYTFQLTGPAMTDAIYNSIADRIVAARRAP